MFINSQNISLTLFVSVLVLSIAVDANDFHPNRRAHDDLKRLVKKRSPFPATDDSTDGGLLGLGGGGIVNVVPNPNASASSPLSASAASASASGNAAGASISASAPSVSAPSVIASDSASASQSASASASVSATSTSATVTAASTPPPTPTPPPAETPNSNDDTVPKPKSTVTSIQSVLGAAATTPPTPAKAASTKTKSTVTTILIVVAASIGGLAILWTVFRKWKLGHSSKFDERMAPIDFQPTTHDGIIPTHRRASSRASSFNSSANHDNGVYRDQLNHDLTATPANLAPVGGYADLARGPSPQPQMQEALGRGPSMRSYNDGRPAYDTGVPLHHQAGYGQGQAEAYDYNGDAIRF